MENELYNQCEIIIQQIVIKQKKLQNKRNSLVRRLSEICYIRDTADEQEQKRYFKNFLVKQINRKLKAQLNANSNKISTSTQTE